jgi:hydroxypyruvate isomerase
MPFSQSFAWWSFTEGREPAPDLLEQAAAIGYKGVDFLPPALWARARDSGIELVIVDGHESIDVGFNDRSQHRDLSEQVRRNLELAVTEQIRFLSVAAGSRAARGDQDGLAFCAEALAPLAAEAADAGVALLMEPLNTKVDHPDHECDLTQWAADLIARVDSPGLRLLYDGYHAQIMEGDLIRTMRRNLPVIAHVHTAGAPGRHDLDDHQEINWRAIARWLDDNYTGFVAHEFIPRGDPVDALRHAFAIIDDACRSSVRAT